MQLHPRHIAVLMCALTLSACGSVQSNTAADASTTSDASAGGDAASKVLCDATDTALVACYEFEPAPSPLPPTTLVDSSSAGNSGTLSGVSFVAGHDGQALRFDPATSKVTIRDSPSLDVSSVTMEMWARTDTVVAANSFGELFNNDQKYTLKIVPGNVIDCRIVAANGTPNELMTTATLAVGQWAHLACTYDGATGSVHIFLNGQTVATSTFPSTGINKNNTNGSTIGTDSPCTSVPCGGGFSGLIDSLRIWNRVRSPAEICADATSGQTGSGC